MRLVGLTGGIGSGKSTVSQLLADRGAVLVDADAIVREVQEPGQPVFQAIVDHFGPTVVAADGNLDRPALAAMVFGNDDQLKALNKIVHPAVNVEILRRAMLHLGTDDVVVLDIPLLVEGNRYKVLGVIVVDLPVEVAIERLVEYRGFTEEDARARIARQVSREERLAKADFVIDNSGGPDDLPPQIDACWAWIQSLPPFQPTES